VSGTQPKLKRHLSIVVHGPDHVELRHGVWNPESYTLRDESQAGRLHRLVKRLDGAARPSQIAREEDVPLEDVEGLIDHLYDLGLIEDDATTALDRHLDRLVPWRSDSEPPAGAVTMLGDGQATDAIARYLRESMPELELRSDANGAAAEMVRNLSGRDLNDGLAFEEALDAAGGWRDSLVIHASTTIDPVELRVLNRVCFGAGVPWLHAALDGPFILVGPLVVPGRSACYECLEKRVTMNLRERASYVRYKEAIADHRVAYGTQPVQPVLVGLLASHAALETLNFLATGSTFTINKLLAIYIPTMEIVYNEVLRVPSCPTCAPAAEQHETGVYFDTGALFQVPSTSQARAG
jgi:bacteriocin biosynthesis cyclodehydratase domain-containing protein